MEQSPPPTECAPADEEPIDAHDQERPPDARAPNSSDDSVVDVSGKTWEVSVLDRDAAPLSGEDFGGEGGAEGLYVYHNTFNLVPRGIRRMAGLKTLKFFANDIEVLPPEVGDLVDLERLQVKVSSPGISGLLFPKLKSLKELELAKVPPRLAAFSVLSDISGLNCLTKLTVCHFSIRYLPPEIGSLKQLEELDLSFNKLKKLPNDISELGSLRSLVVANNKLIDLPPGISSLKNLKNLDLSNNRLTSLTELRLASMQALQYLDLQYNKLPAGCYVPSWVSCNLTGNVEDSEKDKNKGGTCKPSVAASMHDSPVLKLNRSCNGCHGTSSCLHFDASLSIRYHGLQRMKRKGWKRRDLIQQRARQEHLNHSRKCKGEGNDENMAVKMADESLPASNHFALQVAVEKESSQENSTKSAVLSDDTSSNVDAERSVCVDDSSAVVSQDSTVSEKIGTGNCNCLDDCLCSTSTSMGLNEDCDLKVEGGIKSPLIGVVCRPNVSDKSSCETSIFISKSKRHSEKFLDSPKPSKCLKPGEGSSDMSCKYSVKSFCSIHDILPDGFYDAGRNRPHRSLEDYEKSLCLDSREVILLDREKDEELDAIVFSAQLIMSRLKRACAYERNDYQVDNLHRASILALFVSDCFGGSERSDSVMRARRLVLLTVKQQPFVCTCPSWSRNDKDLQLKQIDDSMTKVNFTEMCEKSIRLIKANRKSDVVPIGTVQFGVCRHRAVLMKYLCDRVNPPIPCELVRGYLDFMPHAWNSIPIMRANSMIRMIVDSCYPTDIREETDPEFFCRYVPLSRLRDPLNAEDVVVPESLGHSASVEVDSSSSSSVFCSRFGTVDAAFKVCSLEADFASDEEVRNFEYKFLGEVRILGALRKHRCIVDIYGHQLSSEWVPATDRDKAHRRLKSVIIMEYVKGGSLKNYIDQVSEKGEKCIPVDVILHIAREVACAIMEMHSKLIIHRDIKSDNILFDLDSSRSDGVPLVKLSDFDRSVPLHSSSHTCCIAHLGIHPPDVCVGTPRWMAPEVVHAMHQRNPYGLEIDIWSYGCLLLELLTLQIPFSGQSESDVYNLLQMKQRPTLPLELETLASSKEPLEKDPCDDAAKLKLLVDLFYKCTEGNPGDRPSAADIFDSLCTVSTSLYSDSSKQ